MGKLPQLYGIALSLTIYSPESCERTGRGLIRPLHLHNKAGSVDFAAPFPTKSWQAWGP